MSSWLEAAPPEEVAAGSLKLRRLRIDDAELLARLINENLRHLQPWMPWAQSPHSVDEQLGFLERMQAAWEGLTDFGFTAVLDGEAIGGMGLHTRQGPGTLEIGYWMAAAHTGRGHATAASRALTGVGFGLRGVERVEIRCDQANGASAAVARKLGYRLRELYDREPAAPGETGRAMVWEMRREDWGRADLG